MNRITDLSFDTLPNSLKGYENIKQLAGLIVEVMNGTAAEMGLGCIWARLDELSEELLDVLAYDLHIDWYDYSYSIEQKRNVIKTSISVHKKLGTRYAVETALQAAYPNSSVIPWFEEGGSGVPYTFDVVMSISENESAADISQVVSRIVRYYKSLRDHVGKTRFISSQNVPFYVGCALRQTRYQNVAPADCSDTVINARVYAGAALAERRSESILCEVEVPAGTVIGNLEDLYNFIYNLWWRYNYYGKDGITDVETFEEKYTARANRFKKNVINDPYYQKTFSEGYITIAEYSSNAAMTSVNGIAVVRDSDGYVDTGDHITETINTSPLSKNYTGFDDYGYSSTSNKGAYIMQVLGILHWKYTES